MGRQVFYRGSLAICTRMPSPVTMRSFSVRTRPFGKWLVGRGHRREAVVRRKFFDAVRSYPRQSHQVLEWIRQLYDIEDRSRTWSPEARRQLRVVEAIPVLDKIEASLAGLARTILPKSSLAKAVTYARNQWEALRRYTEDGRLTIDNNVSERTLRHLGAGRTGSFWAVKLRGRERRCCARS